MQRRVVRQGGLAEAGDLGAELGLLGPQRVDQWRIDDRRQAFEPSGGDGLADLRQLGLLGGEFTAGLDVLCVDLPKLVLGHRHAAAGLGVGAGTAVGDQAVAFPVGFNGLVRRAQALLHGGDLDIEQRVGASDGGDLQVAVEIEIEVGIGVGDPGAERRISGADLDRDEV